MCNILGSHIACMTLAWLITTLCEHMYHVTWLFGHRVILCTYASVPPCNM